MRKLSQKEQDDISKRFTSPLHPLKRVAFAEWKSMYAPNDSGYDYDLQGAFNAGVLPDKNGHWPDTFKKPNHPTFSIESKYAVGPYATRAGRWVGDAFIPAPVVRALLQSLRGPK